MVTVSPPLKASLLCRGQKFKGAETPLLDGKNPNPFAERPSTARQMAQAKSALNAALDELDKPVNMPEGLDPSVWQRMCQARRAKIESENLVSDSDSVVSQTDSENVTHQIHWWQKHGELGLAAKT